MRHTSTIVLALAITFVCNSNGHAGEVVPMDSGAVADDPRPISRVRSEDPAVAALIARAYALSGTFGQVVDTINATNGLVYVKSGRCRRVRACMPLKVTMAGPHRILWVFVDLRKGTDCEVMASIGHELWHAAEVLRETSLTSDGDLYLFYARVGYQPLGGEIPPKVWETTTAQRVGFDVLTELQDPRKAACEALANSFETSVRLRASHPTE